MCMFAWFNNDSNNDSKMTPRIFTCLVPQKMPFLNHFGSQTATRIWDLRARTRHYGSWALWLCISSGLVPETCTGIAAEAILPGGGCHGLVSLCLSSSFAWRNVCNHSALEDLAELLSTCNLTMAISIDRWRLPWSCFYKFVVEVTPRSRACAIKCIAYGICVTYLFLTWIMHMVDHV